MFNGTVQFVPRSPAIRHAAAYLQNLGISVTETCAPDVTHLLLPVPSFTGGDEYLAHLLTKLPDGIIISGGNLSSPLLENYACVDYLQDPFYLSENASITARCAMQILLKESADGLAGKKALLMGWGRIGKCLVPLLKSVGADITVGVRKAADLAMIRALGCRSINVIEAADEAHRYDVIINTVPHLLLSDIHSKEGSILLELASKPGMTGRGIIDGRGLPGKMAPAESGELIAKSFIRLSL